jgi:hypothetical protein
LLAVDGACGVCAAALRWGTAARVRRIARVGAGIQQLHGCVGGALRLSTVQRAAWAWTSRDLIGVAAAAAAHKAKKSVGKRNPTHSALMVAAAVRRWVVAAKRTQPPVGINARIRAPRTTAARGCNARSTTRRVARVAFVGHSHTHLSGAAAAEQDVACVAVLGACTAQRGHQ